MRPANHAPAIAIALAVLSLAGPHRAASDVAAPGKASNQIATGRYLVRAGDCVSCHTTPGGAPFAGGRYLPTPFGALSVPNITPDRDTGIGAWSDEDFYHALHEGIGRHGEYLYPAFPFPWYTKITRTDVSAIKAYLFSIPAVHAPRLPLKLVFPANQRAALAAWRALFFKPAEFAPDPQQSKQVNRGAYLVTGLGHCGECHNRRNIAGVSRWSGALEGGPIEGWYAPNLTSDAREGIGSWTSQQLAHYLKTGQTTHGRLALGPMKEVIDESLSHLDATDLLAIGLYLKSVPPRQTYPATVATEFAGPRPPGAETYLSYCGYCHRLHGEGLPGQVSELKGNGAVMAQGAENVMRVVLGGQLARDGLAPMPAIGAQMTDQQVADAVNYVRNAFGNAAPGAPPGAVAQLRKVTRTLLNGQPPQGCPGVSDTLVAAALQRHGIYAKLSQITDVSMLGVIDSALPALTQISPRRRNDDLVNDLTDAYCTTLADKPLSSAERAERLGTFATLTYGQLQTKTP